MEWALGECSFSFFVSKLSEPHANAQVPLSGQMSTCTAEKFLVILVHFWMLLGVIEKNVFVHYTLCSIQRIFTKCFLIHFELLFKASFK